MPNGEAAHLSPWRIISKVPNLGPRAAVASHWHEQTVDNGGSSRMRPCLIQESRSVVMLLLPYHTAIPAAYEPLLPP